MLNTSTIKTIIATHYFKKIVLIITLIIIGLASTSLWWQSKHFVSTDDAYVNANIVQVAPRVTGQVTHLYTTNNQYVTENQPLFDLDPVPFQLATNEAMAQLAKDQAQLNIAQLTSKRTLKLVQKNVASAQEGDTVEANLRSSIAAIQLSQANLERVLLNLKYTKVTAPTSGWITNVTLRAGNIVQANQPLFALISDQTFWIDANFKETELGKIHPQQQADIVIDMYPKHHFTGIVESISGGSGSAFSLLPPQNATGNWVKVTQRVPVRVRVVNPDANFPLRIGTSATVTIRIG